MKITPILMEDYFDPGFKTKPAVVIGSQTIQLFSGNAMEQAWEGCSLAAASKNDLAVVRNFDPLYLDYWKSLMDHPSIINLKNSENDLKRYLTDIILENPNLIKQIKDQMDPKSKLMIFLPTSSEQKLANKLGISLHGSPKIDELYGTKSGIRKLAQEFSIKMPPGFICLTISEVRKAIKNLSSFFETIVIKHDKSLSGYFTKKLEVTKITDLVIDLNEIAGGRFTEGEDIVVVEGWVDSTASLCAHIEIVEGQKPIVCAGWQQIIANDGISYRGAGPLMLSSKAMESFNMQVNRITSALYKKGAVGSFGPDFLIVDEDCLLMELNARVPFTAYPLEIVKQIRGTIGSGFLTQHVQLSRVWTFSEVKEALQKEGLFISKKDKNAKGVVPYNIGLLPWKMFDVAVMADSWEEVLEIMYKVETLYTA